MITYNIDAKICLNKRIYRNITKHINDSPRIYWYNGSSNIFVFRNIYEVYILIII